MENKTKILLTTEEALLFREYMRHREKIGILIDRGVFDVRNGSVVLDFDKNSTLQTIRFTGYMFSRKHEQLDFQDPSSFKTL